MRRSLWQIAEEEGPAALPPLASVVPPQPATNIITVTPPASRPAPHVRVRRRQRSLAARAIHVMRRVMTLLQLLAGTVYLILIILMVVGMAWGLIAGR
jgi:hypothetical protein